MKKLVNLTPHALNLMPEERRCRKMKCVVVEIDVPRGKFAFGDNLATEHVLDLARALSQIPRVVEFLQYLHSTVVLLKESPALK